MLVVVWVARFGALVLCVVGLTDWIPPKFAFNSHCVHGKMPHPLFPHCFATLFYNVTSGGTTARRSFVLDEAMVRLFVSRMLNMTSLPIFVLINRDNDAKSVLGPWLSSGQVRLRRVRPVVVEPPGTHTWYRMTHTKFQAWTLFRGWFAAQSNKRITRLLRVRSYS